MSTVSKELQKLLSKYPSIEIIEDGKKLKCKWSGHEMPSRPESLTSYVGGKKFKKLQAEHASDYEKYKRHLEPSRKKHREHQLFCKLTLRHLNKQPHHIERHVNGRRFQKAFARWEECEKTGEKFVPRGGHVKRTGRDSDEEKSAQGDVVPHFLESDDESGDSDINLSDLYPESEGDENEADVEDKFTKRDNGKENGGADDESDFEFEELTDQDEKKSAATTKDKKRKSEETGIKGPQGKKRTKKKASK